MIQRALSPLFFTISLYWATILAFPMAHVQFINTNSTNCALLATSASFQYDCNYMNNPKQNYDYSIIAQSNDSNPYYSIKSELTNLYLCCSGTPSVPCTAQLINSNDTCLFRINQYNNSIFSTYSIEPKD